MDLIRQFVGIRGVRNGVDRASSVNKCIHQGDSMNEFMEDLLGFGAIVGAIIGLAAFCYFI